MFPIYSISPVQIIGIIIACVIVVGIVIYFIVDRIKNKKFIESIEKRKDELKKIEAEKEAARAEYRKAKQVGDEFLADSGKDKIIADAKKKMPSISAYIQNEVSVNDIGKLDDEKALAMVIEIKDTKVYTQKVRNVVVTTTQLNAFEDNAIVNPISLAAKGIIPKYGHYHLVVQAKAPLKKALQVEAHEYDEASMKMILLTGGTVIKVI